VGQGNPELDGIETAAKRSAIIRGLQTEIWSMQERNQRKKSGASPESVTTEQQPPISG